MSHTPGEWKCGEGEPFVYALNSAGTNRFFVSVQGGWLAEGRNKPDDARTSHEELMANARLIAAAPEMYEELRYLRRTIDNMLTDGYLPAHAERVSTDALARLDSLIAKAGGK